MLLWSPNLLPREEKKRKKNSIKWIQEGKYEEENPCDTGEIHVAGMVNNAQTINWIK